MKYKTFWQNQRNVLLFIGTLVFSVGCSDLNSGDTSDNAAPVAVMAEDLSALSEVAYLFSGSLSQDEDGFLVLWTWDFGDGSDAGTGETVTHTYQSTGEYIVTLTVKDNEGKTDQAQRAIAVEDVEAIEGDWTVSANPESRVCGDAPVAYTVEFPSPNMVLALSSSTIYLTAIGSGGEDASTLAGTFNEDTGLFQLNGNSSRNEDVGFGDITCGQGEVGHILKILFTSATTFSGTYEITFDNWSGTGAELFCECGLTVAVEKAFAVTGTFVPESE